MENRNIIIVLLVIIAVVLACILTTILLPSVNAKQDCKITITSNETLNEEDNFTIKFTDLNGTPIANQVVNVTIDDGGEKKLGTIVTDSNGDGTLDLNRTPGSYIVNCTFEGNDEFNHAKASQKIEIKEAGKSAEENNGESAQQSSANGKSIVESREVVGSDHAPGLNIKENIYSNGDIEHYYSDGSYDYYDSASQEWRYRDADGSSGSMYVGN